MRKVALLILVSVSNVLAAPPIDPSGLYFREDFRVLPAATPITQEHIANQSLTLHLYGAGAEKVKKSHHEEKAGDPFYVWSGQCARHWATPSEMPPRQNTTPVATSATAPSPFGHVALPSSIQTAGDPPHCPLEF